MGKYLGRSESQSSFGLLQVKCVNVKVLLNSHSDMI